MSTNKKKKNIYAIGMGIVWGIIIVGFIINIIEIFNGSDDYYGRATYSLNYIAEEKYATAYMYIQNNLEEGLEVSKKPEFLEVVEMAYYLRAAGHYKMYLENGRTDSAIYYKAKMEEARSGLGELAFTADEIDKQLGLTE